MIDPKYVALKQLHESQCIAVEGLEKENETLKGRIIFLENNLTATEQQVEINKTIMTNAITQNQQQATGYATEIRLLKTVIKNLKEKIAALRG